MPRPRAGQGFGLSGYTTSSSAKHTRRGRGKSAPMPNRLFTSPPQPPTREEVARIETTWREYQDGGDRTDPLLVSALVFSVPRLLARIRYLEEIVKEGRRTP